MTFSVAAISTYGNSVAYSLATGTLPSGLSLSTAGGISGTPSSTVSGTYTFSLAAADAYTAIARSFTKPEWLHLLERAGIQADVCWRPMFRLCVARLH